MANIKSQIKRNRQNEKHRLRNRIYRGSARTAVKDARSALGNGSQETQASVMAAISALDKAAQKGSIHHRNAARRKGRLMKQLAAMGLQPKTVVSEAPATSVQKKEPKPVKEAAVKKETAPKKTAARKIPEKKPAAKKTGAKK